MSKTEYTFEISVAKNGHFLFRTEKALNVMRNPVLAEIVKKFPPEEGYEVCIVDWPMPEGALTTIHKPMPEMAPEQKKRLQEFQEDFKDDVLGSGLMLGSTVTVLYHAGRRLLDERYSDINVWGQHWLDNWETSERRSREAQRRGNGEEG